MNAKKPKAARASRIKAANAAKKVPTAILLKKKAECDAKALKIVEKLMEPQVNVEWMLENLGQINRSHMEDIVEERAIEKICGYVLCENRLTKIVNKKYHISTLRNKVYDVEKVKNFCSYFCYTGMEYLMEQMLTSPLWLRSEEEIPKFTILPKQRTRTKSPPGVEIDIVGIQLPVDDDVPANSNDEHKVKEKTKELNPHKTDTMCDDEKEANENLLSQITVEDMQTDQVASSRETEDKITVPETQENVELEKNPTAVSPPKTECGLPKLENLSLDDTEKIQSKKRELSKEVSELPASIKTSKIASVGRKKLKTRPTITPETLVMRVEKSLTEWITDDTIGLLYGEEIAKQKIIENVTRQDKYIALCRKLNQLQLEEEKDERSLTAQSDELKPLPDFAALKEQAENLKIKVRSFYSGELEPTVPSTEKSDEQPETIIPLTDAHAPNTIRRRIFLDKINKVLSDLLRALAGPSNVEFTYTTDRMRTVKTLVSTFALSATNIVFKTAEWTLVALLIIKILGIIDPAIKFLLSTKKASMYISMILMTYKLESNYIDCLIHSLTSPPIIDNDFNNDDH